MCPNPGVLSAPDFSLTFPPDPAWVRTCRDSVRTSARAYALDTELADVAVLLTSECVSNAVTASAASGCPHPVSLHAEWGLPGAAPGSVPEGSLRIHVRDGAPGLPVVRKPAPADVDGRGMGLVAGLAARWGVCPDGPGPGKSLWFQVGFA